MVQYNAKRFNAAAIIRALFLSWLIAATIEYLLVPGPLNSLSVIAEMSLLRVISLTIGLSILFLWSNSRVSPLVQRWGVAIVALVLCAISLISSYTPLFMPGCIVLVIVLLNYAVRGWNSDPLPALLSKNESVVCRWLTAGVALTFFLFVSVWTVARVYTYSTPTYDFGIFSQMFYNLKEVGLPLTTVERDGLLSHFKVHMSPVYYLLLPFYWIAPTPATLQVLQAAILASAAVPMWLLAKRHGFSPIFRVLFCVLLFLYPAYSGGTSYDIHENAFLTPLILWLFYAIDTRNHILTGLFTLLVLAVKEDAAVYTAVIGLFVIVCGLIRKEQRRVTISGILIFTASVVWFLVVTGYLSKFGDGVMTYRYGNFIYDGSDSLFTVIKAVIMCPMKVLYECTDREKFEFIIYTMLPLLGIPLFTRRYERYILLIPYLLVNLMSDYQYQHDIFFQYTFGSTAFLFYLVIVNLADIKSIHIRNVIPVIAVILSAVCFVQTVIPVAVRYPERYQENKDSYRQIQEVLEAIPENVSVAATTFYTVPLSQRSELYDIRYTTKETVLNCEYVVLTTTSQSCYKKYETDSTAGFDSLVSILLENGYILDSQIEGTLQIYRKQ